MEERKRGERNRGEGKLLKQSERRRAKRKRRWVADAGQCLSVWHLIDWHFSDAGAYPCQCWRLRCG